MEYILKAIFFFGCFSLGFSQERTVKIEWMSADDLLITSSKINVEGADPFFVDESGFTEELISTWSRGQTSYVGSVASGVVLEPVSQMLVDRVDVNLLPNTFEVSVSAKMGRDKYLEVLSFNPLVYSKGQIKRIVSFNLQKRDLSRRSAKNLSVPSRSSSVLATGQWKRFEIDQTGVYRVTANFLSSIGLNLNGVDPRTIKIYGNGGKPLPYENSQNRFYDVPEVPVKMVGAEDGVFSGEDYLLFYATGVRGFDEDNDTNLNPFSDNTFYYVTTGGANHKSIVTVEKSNAISDIVFNTYDFETFIEKDLVNLGGIGRKWFGDSFGRGQNRREYNFDIPSPVKDSDVVIVFPFGGLYQVPPSISVRASSANQESRTVGFQSGFSSDVSGYGNSLLQRLVLKAGEKLNVTFEFDQKGDPSSQVFLDYLRIMAKSNLRGVGRQFVFSNSEQISATGISEFMISNAENISSVWNVTDPFNITERLNNSGVGNSKESAFSVKVDSGIESKFLALDERDFYSPIRLQNSNVFNQDLKGNVFRNGSQNNFQGEIDYLIITRSDFVDSANRLANFRRKQDGFNVKVVTVDQIYNEFSTGQQDITAIRNFVKYIYDNANSAEGRLKYLCVIGDGSYDYKDRIEDNTNIVPLYFAENSINFATSYSTDDYYGIMGDNEGDNLRSDLLDIAVGRIIAPTPDVANDMIDKIVRYYNQSSYGTWRNNFLFVADDVDDVIDASLELKLDFVAEQMKAKLPNANIRKIFTDAFEQELTSAGARYFQAQQNLLNAFEAGSAYINYFGHGGEEGLSSEFIFRATDAQELTNRDRLTVFTTLTCELTRFDNPSRETAGEFLYWNKNGGAVAMLTTIRNLFVSTGLDLNPVLADALFDDSQNAIPIGEALRVAKNNLVSRGDNRLTVFCIGDPALKISFPKPEVVLTKINDIQAFNFNGSLRALDKVKLSGIVVDANNASQNPLENFNGEIGVTLFDKDEQRETLANDGTFSCLEINSNTGEVTPRNFRVCSTSSDNKLFTLKFENIGNQVFNGRATVGKGVFDIEFVLSRNVQLPVGEGRIGFYAQNQTVLEDQSGSAKVMIGGLNTEAPTDNEKPLINLFLNNENFLDGQLVNNTPVLIARLSDANGINTAGGVGHDIVAVVDGDETNPIRLNDFYTTELNDSARGIINFRLKSLSEGQHTLSLRASDVYNNVAFEQITFQVGGEDDFTISEVLNYPNPFVNYTEFWFNHTGPSQDVLEVMVRVMTITGKVVTTKFATLSGNTNSYRGDITWDGKDDFGNNVGKGVYLYNIVIKSTLTNKTVSKLEKLVVL